jgi:hypothetical protein
LVKVLHVLRTTTTGEFMNSAKKTGKDFLHTALICSSFLFTFPNMGNSSQFEPTITFSPSSDLNSIAHHLFNHAEGGDVEGINQQLEGIAETLARSDDALSNSCHFLQSLVNRMNAQYGASLTLSKLLQITRESMHQFQIPEDQIENCAVGLDLIELHQSSLCEKELLDFVHLAKHKKSKSDFWSWLAIATVSAAATVVCIIVPQVAPAVIGGAVEVGKAAFGK